MSLRLTNSTTKICAMCMYWNGLQGGNTVKPCVNRQPFFEFNPEEIKICYKNHQAKKGWNSCSEWVKKYE